MSTPALVSPSFASGLPTFPRSPSPFVPCSRYIHGLRRTSAGRSGVLCRFDTPETVDPRKPVQCYGPEASAFTKSRLDGRQVVLERDVESRDRYGRLLAYVSLDGRRFNDELLEAGYARLLVIAPNGSHARTMLQKELAAKRTGRGLWSACAAR